MIRRERRSAFRSRRGFTLIELMIVVAIIGILAAIAIPLFSSLTASSRLAKAQADVRAIATAVNLYYTHMDVLPATLATLTAPATNASGQTAGPFLNAVPVAPSAAWTAYNYVPGAAATFTVSTSGEGHTVSFP